LVKKYVLGHPVIGLRLQRDASLNHAIKCNTESVGYVADTIL